MPFVDLNNVHNPSTGTAAPASWGDQARDNLQALRGPARVRAHRTTVQSIPHNVETSVVLDTELVDTHGMHDNVTNADRLTVPANFAGDWLIGATIKWAPSADPIGTFRYTEILVNGAVLIDSTEMSPGASGYATNNLSGLWPNAVVGDFFTVRVKHDIGENLNIQPNGYTGIVFWAHFVGSGVG